MSSTHPLPTGMVSLRTTHNPGQRQSQNHNDNDAQAHAQIRESVEYCATVEGQYKTAAQTPWSIAGGLQ